jgi:hypothetical protein
MTATFFGWVFLIVLLSWGPIYAYKLISKKVDPSDFEKIMKHVKRNAINT